MEFADTLQKQNSISSFITRFLTNLKKLGQDKLTLAVYEARLELLESYWTKFQDRHEELICLPEYASSDYARQDVFTQIQETYLTVKVYLRDRMRELMAETNPRGSSTSTHTVSGRLPKISLPTFSGNYLEWESFRDLFTSLVHEAPDLTNVMRLQYLKSSVTGEAAKLISGISVTEANYEGAWTALAQRYDNKGLILAHHFNQLFSLRAIHTETAANLKHLRDTISESRRAMKNLGRPVEYWDDWFVHITVQRLNYSTRKDWETTRGITKDIPTYADLMNFMDSRIRALEAVPPPAMPNERTRNRNFVPPSLRSHASTMQSPGSTKANQSCELCDENHYLGHCPEFKRNTPLQRKDIVIRLKRCLNCLHKHATNSCPSAQKCFVCHKAHHTLLHDLDPATTSISTAHVLMPPNVPVTSTLLATAIIRVTAPNGNSSLIRALLDQGSEATFISEDLTQRLHLQRTKVHIPVTGLGATPCGTVKALVRVQLSPTHKNYSSTVSAEAYVLPHLTKTFPPRRISTHSWPHLKALTLSDPGSSTFSKIDLVIGADLYGHILLDGFIKGPPGTPIAQNTIFGWVLSGKVQDSSPDSQPGEVTAHHCSLDLTLTEELMKFWEIEELNQRPPLTPEELQCEEHFQTTHSRDPDGRFVVRLPKRPDVPLGNSHLYAVRSLQRNELRRLKDESLNQAYRQFMKEYLELGHMAVVSAASAPTGQSFYLPHHAVWKFEGSSPKLRVVFNASARTSSGFSLNDYLLPGPKLQQEIGHVLIRWRTHAVALTSDIVKMFRQISVHPEDQPLQRILWRDTPDQELQTFQLQTVTYGTTCAPYLAIRCLHQLARDEVDKFPEASKILQTQTYVDDILFGAETEERALALKTQLEGLLTAGGFQLAKWSSNCPDLAGSDNSPHVLSDGTVKTLGILWNPRTDNFEFQIKLETPEKITKRSTLSCIAKLFDPLGWLAPVLISAKIFIQDLWTVKCDWDTALPPSLEAVWSLYYSSLTQLRDLRIPRWISYSPETSWELHGFCDASQRAYAASVYVRTETAPGTFRTHLLTAKTKVAPLKVISLPRLELSGAVLLIRLLKHVCDAMQPSSSPCVHAWTDSQVVLHWINAVPARWKCFVANRVSEIHQTLPQTIWHHVNSADNPADPASRGVPAASIKDNSLWWHGPHWLSKSSTSWPPSTIAPFSPEALQEESLRVQTFNTIISEPWNLSERYSSLTRLIRVTSWLFRFNDNARVPKEMRNLEPLSVPELTKSHWYWIKKVQQQQFAEEIGMLRCGKPVPKRSPIFRLCPLLDSEGILRVGGRLENSPLSYDERHPIILSSKAHFVRLLAENCHLRTLHGGPQLTLNQLQDRYWIVGGRNLVKKIIRTCITCIRYSRGPSEVPLMGQLPAARVSPARPFFHSGLDYAGPIKLRHSKGRGRLTYKGYIALFVCMATKAVHLEAVSECSTAAFLAAFKRFCSRRGIPSTLSSDQATTFKGADAELQGLLASASKEHADLVDSLAKDGTQWHFIPPHSPHFGGLWEAGVRSVKSHLRKVIGDTILTFEELTTVLAEIEACLNSRPLTPLSTCPRDPSTLTPGHFLIGSPLTVIPEPSLFDQNVNRLTRWQLIRRLSEQFWRRWSKEYIQQLQLRQKWAIHRVNLEPGDVVIIKEDNLPPSKWHLGRVFQTHPGEDGVVRVVTVRTATSTYRRPVVKLCKLPVESANVE